MNLYFLVEGKTERKVYPQWISSLAPCLSRIDTAQKASENNYYLITGGGYPSLLDNHLADSIEEINDCGNYDILVLCLDSDAMRPNERTAEVTEFMEEKGLKLTDCSLKIIVQNKCIETWFMGNRKIYPRSATSPEFIECGKFYNVSLNDPELMGKPSDFYGSHSVYHYEYLRHMLREKNITYSKTRPRGVGDLYYINELKRRIHETPDHLLSLRNFFDFCEELKA